MPNAFMTLPNVTPRVFFLLTLATSLLAMLVFSPGLGGGFLLDDAHTIVNNAFIQIQTLDPNAWLDAAASFHAGHGSRPLAMLSFAFDFWRHGSLDPATFKATNLFLHGLTTFFLALFLRRLLELAQWPAQRAAIGALVLALAWAVHPIQVSAVLYVVQRMQTLVTLFMVLALWAYLGLRRAQIEGRRGWPHGLAAALFWLLALASKEDAVLLPAYTLALELTVLRFSAAEPWRAHSLRRAYAVLTLLGTALYVFWVLPTYWSWDTYSGRDFSSVERLLTQCRVLVMYLGQILWPWPSHIPFNYDTFVVSRGLLQPPTTLLSLLLLLVLCGWAWRWRHRRPLFAFGVLLFFAGHIITSNVIALELVFEHRNHLPSIGVVLAVGDLLLMAAQRWPLHSVARGAGVAVLLGTLAVAGGLRAHAWGDPIRLAEYNVRINPDSPRAWLALGGAWFDLAGRKAGKDSPYLTRAIETVEAAAARTDSSSAYSNIVIYKSIQGTATQSDWDRLLANLATAPMTPPTKSILWTTIQNLQAKIGLDEVQALRLIDLIAERAAFGATEQLRIGLFIYTQTTHPDQALPHFLRAAEGLPAGDHNIAQLSADLRSQNRGDWAQRIESANARGAYAPDTQE
ncbi:MAG TPA: hypothetical protein VFN29_13530 [Chiayiivirga sp.]|nr:hypothetical protein [Chiayiivirga sp.]